MSTKRDRENWEAYVDGLKDGYDRAKRGIPLYAHEVAGRTPEAAP